MSCIYVIRSNVAPDLIKIGKTGDWSRRSRELKVGTKTELINHFPFDQPGPIETAAHRGLAAYRLPQSEWFRLSAEQLQDVCQQLGALSQKLSAPPPTPEELAAAKALRQAQAQAKQQAQLRAAQQQQLAREKAWHSQPLALAMTQSAFSRMGYCVIAVFPLVMAAGFASAVLGMGCPDQDCRADVSAGVMRTGFAAWVLASAAAGLNAAANETSKRQQFLAKHPTT